MTTPAPAAGTLTVVVPMFRLGRGLRLSSFRREWLVKDVVAGIVLTTLLVPQGRGTPAVQPEADPTTADPTARI